MHVTWLGQAGLYIETPAIRILIDPYLSDAVGKRNPANRRRVPVDERFLNVCPDVLIFTHIHLDHYDPETAAHYLAPDRARVTVLAPASVWGEVRKTGGSHRYVQFDRRTEWTQDGVRFTAVTAVHSDPYAIGVIVDDGKQTLYVTGDTLYSRDIFAELPEHIDAVFLPINGEGNNMNAVDAARFAERTGARVAVPLHFGLFDSPCVAEGALDPRTFKHPGRVIPEMYREIPLE